MPGSLTLGQWDGDDDAVTGADPQAIACDEQGGNAHEGEAQLACAWGEGAARSVPPAGPPHPRPPSSTQHSLTQHLADIGLDVHVLQVLVGVGVVQPQRGVQADGHPHTIADPRQLPHLALPPWMGIK